MAACDGMYKDPEGWRLLIGLALETAMRAGELIGMLWDEVNIEQRFIAIPKEREKTRKGRQVPLSTKALAIFAKLKKRRATGEPRVFVTMPTTSPVLGRGFKRITKRAECVDLHFHDLRHEAVARFFERTTLQTMEIALITGHTELKTLQRYANLRPAILASKLDGAGMSKKMLRALTSQ
jgi:integrase